MTKVARTRPSQPYATWYCTARFLLTCCIVSSHLFQKTYPSPYWTNFGSELFLAELTCHIAKLLLYICWLNFGWFLSDITPFLCDLSVLPSIYAPFDRRSALGQAFVYSDILRMRDFMTLLLSFRKCWDCWKMPLRILIVSSPSSPAVRCT